MNRKLSNRVDQTPHVRHRALHYSRVRTKRRSSTLSTLPYIQLLLLASFVPCLAWCSTTCWWYQPPSRALAHQQYTLARLKPILGHQQSNAVDVETFRAIRRKAYIRYYWHMDFKKTVGDITISNAKANHNNINHRLICIEMEIG